MIVYIISLVVLLEIKEWILWNIKNKESDDKDNK